MHREFWMCYSAFSKILGFDIVVMGDAVYEANASYRHSSSMVRSLLEIGRSGGRGNIVLGGQGHIFTVTQFTG
ncbi:hypothetical protein [Pyrobaculum aerophilum]|uniref:hypothetical protein n=1 Tax=Pyrobaculum aerophilum TaxID=13773 RepID=UPI0023EF93DC|nr:hypothetical protein [Pyrobaculum aerophilum]MCX8135997.1 hypothetical protein [Pyrobaculum aerophilum]